MSKYPYNFTLNKLEGNEFIEVFHLEDADDSIFGNYQRYDFYQVLWFTEVEGNSNYLLDFEEYTIHNNQIVLIFPGQIDRLDTRGKKGYLFAIHTENFFHINQRMQSDYLNGYFSNTFLTPDENTKEILNKITELIFKEYNGDKRIILLENYMEAFLFHVSALFEHSDTFKSISDLTVSRLMRLIDENFINQRETDFYAKRLGVSNRKINEISMKGTGKTIKQHLQERLVLEIKKEIRMQQKSLKEIAFDLGFSEPAYFTRFFKQHTSITPSEFRER